MPHFTGIDFIKAIDKKPLIIFTTAYSNYAVEGFDFGAVDYLIKPIPFNRFLKAVVRAQHAFTPPEVVHNSNTPIIAADESNNFMFVRAEYEKCQNQLCRYFVCRRLERLRENLHHRRKICLDLDEFDKIGKQFGTQRIFQNSGRFLYCQFGAH